MLAIRTFFSKHFSSQLNSGLFHYWERRQRLGVRVCLTLGADPNLQPFVSDNSRISLMALSARFGRVWAMELLHRYGAPLLEPHAGWQPIHHACAKGQSAVVRWIHQQKSPLNCSTDPGWEPLFVCIKEQKLDSAAVLLELGANPNGTTEKKEPYLYFCIRKHQMEAIHLLLKHGADPHLCDHKGESPLHVASAQGHEDICQILLTYGLNPQDPNPWGINSISLAKGEGHFSLASFLEAHCISRALAPTGSTEPPGEAGDSGDTTTDEGSGKSTRFVRRL